MPTFNTHEVILATAMGANGYHGFSPPYRVTVRDSGDLLVASTATPLWDGVRAMVLAGYPGSTKVALRYAHVPDFGAIGDYRTLDELAASITPTTPAPPWPPARRAA